MPYQWTQSPAHDTQAELTQAELTLWPHNALPPRGIALFVLATFAFMVLPMVAVLGTLLLWGLLPFMLLALGGIWYALSRNRKDRHIVEVLRISAQDVHLTRHAPQSKVQEWHCNPYWTQVTCHEAGGPVPHYVTLRGSGREVEIGAFLSEDERLTLYDDLTRALARVGRS